MTEKSYQIESNTYENGTQVSNSWEEKIMENGKKVISFSLYGNNPKYVVGMLKNVELAKKIYPDWEVWIYYAKTDEAALNTTDAVLINMEGSKLPGRIWRFLPNVESLIVRDSDSRLSMRERLAVDEWIASGKSLHVMRDHPHHKFAMLAGMWGIKSGDYSVEAKVYDWCKNDESWGNMQYDNADQRFLRDVIYRDFKGDMMVHESSDSGFPNGIPFPSEMVDRRFVGEIYDENDERSYQYTLI